jgi:hypothetical protein
MELPAAQLPQAAGSLLRRKSLEVDLEYLAITLLSTRAVQSGANAVVRSYCGYCPVALPGRFEVEERLRHEVRPFATDRDAEDLVHVGLADPLDSAVPRQEMRQADCDKNAPGAVMKTS